MSSIDGAYEQFCEQRFPLPSEEQVFNFEDRLGITFPEHYRSFLLNYNGGIFADPEFTAEEDPDATRDMLTFLRGIDVSCPAAELGSPESLSLFWDNDPIQILPIGSTIQGYLILLVVAFDGDDFGTLIHRSFDESFFLADDMEEFFSLLRTPSDG